MKRYVVRHQMHNERTWYAVAYFECAADALAEYEEVRKANPRERVWVIDLHDCGCIADSRR